MARDYSTTELVASIKRRAMLPTNQSTFTAERLASIADEELQGTVVPLVLACGGEHLVSYTDTTLTAALEYDIPSAAIGARVRDAVIVDSSGLVVTDLALVSLDRLHTVDWSGSVVTIRGNKLVFVPVSRPGETLRVYYHRRPNRLVWAATRAAQITAINEGTLTVTVSGSVPSVFTAGVALCAVPSTPPFDEHATGFTVTSTATPDVVVSSVSGLAVGDWLALAGESPVPQLPPEAHLVLAQAVVKRVLQALGDADGYAQAAAEFVQLAQDFQAIASPRLEGEPQKVIGADAIGDARERSRSWGWW